MPLTHSLELLPQGKLTLDILENLGSAIIIVDLNKRILYVNQRTLSLTGFSKEELIGQKFVSSLFAFLDEERCPIEILLNSSSPCEFDALLKRKDQSEFYAHIIVSLINLDSGEKLLIINFFDITERKELEKKLFQASVTDYLTGLYNRRFMSEALQKEKELSDRYNIPFSLILFDLDYFKYINDLYGHDQGDKVLLAIGELLKKKIRASDLSSRWGGEEFLILLRNTTLEQAKIVAEKLRKEICSLKLSPVEKISASFGIASYRPKEPIETTIKRADLALIQAKLQGKNCVIAFEE